jgi:hypothetical protein
VWRRLKQLGVAHLADGLVALPADARTRELLDWVAEQVLDSGGSAAVWLARPAAAAQERELAGRMARERAAEYRALMESVTTTTTADPGASRRRGVHTLRRQWRSVDRRDYFPPPEREIARRAIDDLAASVLVDAADVGADGTPR